MVRGLPGKSATWAKRHGGRCIACLLILDTFWLTFRNGVLRTDLHSGFAFHSWASLQIPACSKPAKLFQIARQVQVSSDNIPQEDQADLKFQPSSDANDPIVAALRAVCKVNSVVKFELLDSRWNGNEALRYDADDGRAFFVKMNRVEDVSVFMAEAVGLSALLKTGTIKVPKPLHLGKLPKVGSLGPGAFMILEWLPLIPFGIMRKDMQAQLGTRLAKLHLSAAHDDLHQGRFGFPVSNFLALTPLDNGWCSTWEELFRRRLSDQLARLYVDKPYARAPVSSDDRVLADQGERILQVLPELLATPEPVRPALIHGDLWIGNSGATKEEAVIYDPACCFAHHEFDLSIAAMFGGLETAFWDAYFEQLPKADGFERRQKVYQLYHNCNLLNLFGDPKVKERAEGLASELLAG